MCVGVGHGVDVIVRGLERPLETDLGPLELAQVEETNSLQERGDASKNNQNLSITLLMSLSGKKEEYHEGSCTYMRSPFLISAFTHSGFRDKACSQNRTPFPYSPDRTY